MKAFSLLELLLVLTLVGILSSIMVPSFSDLKNKNRALVYAHELRLALQFTRASAIALGEDVTFCNSKNHKDCDNSKNWTADCIAITKSGKIMHVWSKIPRQDRLIFHGGTIEKGVRFSPLGFPYAQRGSFFYCPEGKSKNAVSVVLQAAGRIVIKEPTEDEAGRCNF